MSTAKDRARKMAQRRAHAERRDHRQPEHALTADERRNVLRDQRREQRRTVA